MATSGVLGVLVVHATGSRVEEVLRTLAEQTYRDLEVVVAAVGAAVVEPGEVHEVVRVPDGTGYPEAVHRALNEVDWTDARYLLLLHDDVALEPETVERLVERADADDAAIVGAKLVEWDDPRVLQEVGGAIDRFAVRRSALDSQELDHGQHDGTTDVLYCSDACLLVRTDAFSELDGLDRGAWPLYADVDLCWRARVSGRRVEVQPQARVRHAATMSRGGRGLDRLDLLEATEHGRLRFMLRHYAPVGLAVVLPQVLVASLLRVLVSAVLREFWVVRAIAGAWVRAVRELPSLISARRRAPPGEVDDRELIQLGARTVVLELRGERAEWFSRAFEHLARIGRAVLARMREPVSWVVVLAAVVLALVARDVLGGGAFLLGELRPLPTFAGALSDLFAGVRREGLDPFGPAGPGPVVLGLVRSLSVGPALGQKVVLVLPLVVAAAAGARLADVLELGRSARRWLMAAGTANPVTFLLLRDGELGALVTWAASLWLVSTLAVPSMGERVRFRARWALGFAVVAALHPPGLVWLVALGATLVVSRHADGRSAVRLQGLATGVAGAVVLCFPWSFEWFTARTPLVGAAGWLVAGEGSGIGTASLGAGWPMVVWLVVALGASYYVGLTRTTVGLASAGTGALLLGAGGVMPAATMLVGVGTCAMLMLVVVARRIRDELPRYELGFRQAVVVGGTVVLAVTWSVSAVLSVAAGTRSPSPPLHTVSERTGRVLWLSETTGGLRSWTTLSFRHQLSAFPPAGGPVEDMVAAALEAARGGRTHRLGSVLSLADLSHVVALDRRAVRGLDAQADLTPVQTEGATIVFQNDAWRGPALRLAEPPTDPLTARGIAGITRAPERVAVSNWPFGPLTLEAPTDDAPTPDEGVVYVHGGPRGGWSTPGVPATRAAAGFYVAADRLSEPIEIRPPGWWRVFVPLQVALVTVVVLAWLVAAYLARPPSQEPSRPTVDLHPVSLRLPVTAAPVVVLLAGLVLGWAGIGRAASGPFLSSAWYCPPVGEGFTHRVAIVNPNGIDVTYQVRPSLDVVPEAEGVVAARSRETVTVEPLHGAVVESFGRRLAVAAEVSRLGDADATLCASSPRTTHLFPEGGRAATRARPRLFERYIIYNPFADLARASVRFLSPDESISPPALRDVHIPSGGFVVVDPEEQFEPMLDLSTVVTVWQGRAVVARRLRTEEQTSWSLSSELRDGGVLPRAVTQDAVTAVIALNPGDQAATVSIFGAGERGSLPGERFIVPQGTRTSFDVNVLAPDAGGLLVRLTSDRPVAIESLVAPVGRESVSLLPPLSPGRRWVLPMGEGRELVVVNPNPRAVRFTLRRLGPGPALGSFTVEANRVETVPLPGQAPFGVLVSAQSPVTAAAVGPRGSLPGIPLPGS